MQHQISYKTGQMIHEIKCQTEKETYKNGKRLMHEKMNLKCKKLQQKESFTIRLYI